MLRGVPEGAAVEGDPLEGVPNEGQPPGPQPQEWDESFLLPCGAVAGPAQCMCMICLGGADASTAAHQEAHEASTMEDDL